MRQTDAEKGILKMEYVILKYNKRKAMYWIHTIS